MSRLASFHRLTTAICLVLYAVLATVFVLTAPAADPTAPTYLADIAAAGGTAVVSAYAFLGAQAALVIGLIGVAHLLRDRTPVLAPIAVALSIVGAFAHAAYAGFALVVVGASSLPADEAAGAVAALEAALAGPLQPISMISVTGLVPGSILLAVAVFRARLGVWWIGVALLLWIVAEFGLSGMGAWALFASGALLLAAFGGLAVVVLRSDLRDWMTPREAGAALAVPAPAV